MAIIGQHLRFEAVQDEGAPILTKHHRGWMVEKVRDGDSKAMHRIERQFDRRIEHWRWRRRLIAKRVMARSMSNREHEGSVALSKR